MDRKNSLPEKYPWLKITTSVENYVEPNYYDRLLKDYVFNKKSDLVHLKDFLLSLRAHKIAKILELGCGNGRATEVALGGFPDAQFDLVDLSPRMLKVAQSRFAGRRTSIRYVRSDSIAYLEKADKVYDAVFTLWSFSHSTHQILSKMGLRNGKRRIQRAIKKFVSRNMKVGSVFFLIHFDSLSDEQKILIRQWKRAYPIFRDNRRQSPSKRCIDEVFKELLGDGIIKFSATHYKGKPITYRSLDEALEIFMNFHMESFFNKSPYTKEIIEDLTKYFKRFKKPNGSIEITPGCFVYKFIKIR